MAWYRTIHIWHVVKCPEVKSFKTQCSFPYSSYFPKDHAYKATGSITWMPGGQWNIFIDIIIFWAERNRKLNSLPVHITKNQYFFKYLKIKLKERVCPTQLKIFLVAFKTVPTSASYAIRYRYLNDLRNDFYILRTSKIRKLKIHGCNVWKTRKPSKWSSGSDKLT